LRRAHLAGRDDGLVRVQPLIDRAPRFADLLDTDADDPAFAALLVGYEESRHCRTMIHGRCAQYSGRSPTP
jgi:hypothetical protein